MPRVMIHPASYEDICGAVDRAFELFPIECEGKTVLIKPNVLRAARPEEGITTHPALVRAVIEKIETMKPASLVIGDNPGLTLYGANEEGFKKAGLLEVSKAYYRNIGNDSRKMAFNPDFMPEVSVSRIVLEADVVVSLPKFKTHGLTGMTGAIKNSYGLLPGAQKAKLHKAAGTPERFHEMLVEVFRLRVPDFFLVDAIVGMEGNGPVSGNLRDIGLILASDNGVAVDAVMARMMGLDPGLLRFLQKAKESGLGDYDLRNIEIVGLLREIPDFKVPPLSGEAQLGDKGSEARIHGRTLMRPQADPKLCTGCGICVDHCPVSALTLISQIPKVDTEACITCFCCQEICPEKAISLK